MSLFSRKKEGKTQEVFRRKFRKIQEQKILREEYSTASVNITEPLALIDQVMGNDIVITSELEGSDYHAPVLDIDFPIYVIPSATPGHFHLYINKAIPKPKYMALLAVLAEVEIIEPGYARASHARGYTAVRVPWSPKKVEMIDEESTPPPF